MIKDDSEFYLTSILHTVQLSCTSTQLFLLCNFLLHVCPIINHITVRRLDKLVTNFSVSL